MIFEKIEKLKININKLFFYKIKYDVKSTKTSENGASENDTRKVKVKYGMPRIKHWSPHKELFITIGIIGIILILLLLAEPLVNNFDIAKWTAGLNQHDELNLPGKNTDDKK